MQWEFIEGIQDEEKNKVNKQEQENGSALLREPVAPFYKIIFGFETLEECKMQWEDPQKSFQLF